MSRSIFWESLGTSAEWVDSREVNGLRESLMISALFIEVDSAYVIFAVKMLVSSVIPDSKKKTTKEP